MYMYTYLYMYIYIYIHIHVYIYIYIYIICRDMARLLEAALSNSHYCETYADMALGIKVNLMIILIIRFRTCVSIYIYIYTHICLCCYVVIYITYIRSEGGLAEVMSLQAKHIKNLELEHVVKATLTNSAHWHPQHEPFGVSSRNTQAC